jgi:hypothetical protein
MVGLFDFIGTSHTFGVEGGRYFIHDVGPKLI